MLASLAIMVRHVSSINRFDYLPVTIECAVAGGGVAALPSAQRALSSPQESNRGARGSSVFGGNWFKSTCCGNELSHHCPDPPIFFLSLVSFFFCVHLTKNKRKKAVTVKCQSHFARLHKINSLLSGRYRWQGASHTGLGDITNQKGNR